MEDYYDVYPTVLIDTGTCIRTVPNSEANFYSTIKDQPNKYLYTNCCWITSYCLAFKNALLSVLFGCVVCSLFIVRVESSIIVESVKEMRTKICIIWIQKLHILQHLSEPKNENPNLYYFWIQKLPTSSTNDVQL